MWKRKDTKRTNMGLFTKLFSKSKKNQPTVQHPIQISSECQQLMELDVLIKSITSGNRYVARSEYRKKADEYAKTVEYFNVLKNSGMLGDYCAKNGFKTFLITPILTEYENLTDVVDKANDAYIQNAMNEDKEYLDNILHEVDPNILLDDNQRKVVLTDEDYCLVVAGAGAGKTTTVAANCIISLLAPDRHGMKKKVLN